MNHRRFFLKNVAFATIGIALTPSVLAKQVAKQKKIADSENNELGHVLDLRTGSKNNFVCLKGTVYDKSGLLSQAGATITILNPSTGLFKINRMEKITTNEKGAYQFLVDYPQREGKKIPRLKFDITNGTNAYSSEVLLNKFGASISGNHWQLNNQLGDKLFPVKEKINNGVEISLNLSI